MENVKVNKEEFINKLEELFELHAKISTDYTYSDENLTDSVFIMCSILISKCCEYNKPLMTQKEIVNRVKKLSFEVSDLINNSTGIDINKVILNNLEKYATITKRDSNRKEYKS
jgi:hypothetical protein